jgi:hypothetical protein
MLRHLECRGVISGAPRVTWPRSRPDELTSSCPANPPMSPVGGAHGPVLDSGTAGFRPACGVAERPDIQRSYRRRLGGHGPAPVPAPMPGPGPGLQQRVPSGLQEHNPLDHIPIVWFKPLWVYPTALHLVDQWGDAREYDMTTPGQTVELGQDIGVAPLFLPWIGKPVQLQFVIQDKDRGPAVDRFRSLLVRHGWTEGDTHQIDHVQDLFWTGPDQPYNLWPLNSERNKLAGNQFMNLRVTYSNVPGGGPATPATTNVRLSDGLRAPGVNNLLRRWFIIRSIGL